MKYVFVIGLILWSSVADARWQQPRQGCGQWTPCYVRALSRERMSGMGHIVSRSYWSVR